MPSYDRYQWNKEFRERIIALCFAHDWFPRYGKSVIRPEFFETEDEQNLVEYIARFWDAYHRSPEDDEVLAEFSESDSTQDLIYDVLDNVDEELDYARDMAIQFAREQAMKIAILKSVEDMEKGILSKSIERAREALDVGKDLLDIGISVRNIETWLTPEFDEDRISTGFEHVDYHLEGGASKKEYWVILGGTNTGKTQALINIGANAASLVEHANVTHITLEMSAKKIAKRYAARIAGRFYTKQDRLDDYILDFQDMSRVRLRGNIRIKEWPSGTATIDDIEAYLELLLAVGYKTDLLIVDYSDIMKHKHIGEYRHNLSGTTIDLRALAQRRDMVIWSASQANRGGLNAELLDLDDTAEDIGKINNADGVLALCQTKQEYDEQILRIYGAKVRDAPRNWIVQCKVYPNSHTIVSVKSMTLGEMFEEKKQRKSEKKILEDVEKLKDVKSASKKPK